jgi:O-acetyl-ADP-ribose deacetylase (regulator of RNase III)
MTAIVLPNNPQPGGAEDITQVNANFAAILAVVNGDLRNDNFNALAAIARSKLDFGSGLVNADIAAAAAIAGSKMANPFDVTKLQEGGDRVVRRRTGSIANGGTGANTNEVDLQSFTIAANVFPTTGGYTLEIDAAGQITGTTLGKTVRLYANNTEIGKIVVGATSTDDWHFRAKITGTGTASNQKCVVDQFTSNGGQQAACRYTDIALDCTAIITIRTTGFTPNSADEVTSKLLSGLISSA